MEGRVERIRRSYSTIRVISSTCIFVLRSTRSCRNKTQTTGWTSEPAARLLFHVYKPILPFHYPPLYRPLQFEQPHKHIFCLQLSEVLQTHWSAWRETSYYVTTTKRAGQVRGEADPWPPPSPRSVPVTTGPLMNSRTSLGQCIWVTFGVTRRTADGCVFNLISADQLTCGGWRPQGGSMSCQRIIESDQTHQSPIRGRNRRQAPTLTVHLHPTFINPKKHTQ